MHQMPCGVIIRPRPPAPGKALQHSQGDQLNHTHVYELNNLLNQNPIGSTPIIPLCVPGVEWNRQELLYICATSKESTQQLPNASETGT